MDEPPEPASPNPTPTPPLYLPVGSVRALITLLILGTTWLQLLRGLETSLALRDTLLLVLGYYFGARSGKRPPAADQLAAPVDREASGADPLYLPRGAIRLLIVVGFAAVAWKLHESRKLFGPDGTPQPILVLVGTFLAGATVKGSVAWAGHLLSVGLREKVGHVVAAGTLLAVAGHCALEATGTLAQAPPWATTAFLAIVGYYLGKR